MDGFDQETGEVIEQRPQLPAMAESRPQNLIFASQDCGEVFGALCVMQGTMEAPKRTKTAKVKGRTKGGAEYDYSYTYAPLDEIMRSIQTPMKEAGLAVRQFLAVRGGSHVMRTIIAHGSGQWMGCDYPIFWDESRGMQGFASGVTYARRYGLMLALGIAAEDDDDANVADGNVATVSGRAPASRGRQTAGSANPVQSPPPATNGATAPPSASADDRAVGIEQWRNAAKAIDACQTIPEIDALFVDEAGNQTKQWFECKAIITKGDPARAAGAIQQLVDRAEERKTLLMGDDRMHIGEMG